VDRLLEATEAADEVRHFWFRGFRRFVMPLVARAVRGHDTPLILDCGCGTGANLRLLAGFGRAFGIDLNRVGLEFARRKAGGRLARASVTHLPFGDGRFDLVTSFDVIYSLDDEAEAAALDEMYRVLRPGGASVVNVAAMEVLRGNHSVLSQEVRRYSARTLRSAMERAGFRVEDMRYTNTVLFPVMLAVRVAQRMMGLAPPEHATHEITVPPAPINEALAALLALEAHLIQPLHLPFGSSLACLAFRPE
jgi:ubiquinone/menaquinone biosynthesis C-methylase UbiE